MINDEERFAYYGKLLTWAKDVREMDEVMSLLFKFIESSFVEVLTKLKDDHKESVEEHRKQMLAGIMRLHNNVEIFERDKSKDQ